MRKIHKNIIFTIAIFQVLFILLLFIPFFISLINPGDPVIAYLPDLYTDPEYLAMKASLGFNDPIFFRLIKYLRNMFSGQWGISSNIYTKGLHVDTLIFSRLGRTIDLILIPTVIGIFLGLILGKLSIKSKSHILRKVIQILAIIGISFPIFLLSILFQFISIGIRILPSIGSTSPVYGAPSYITGFQFIDSLISGEYHFIPDYLLHLVLPWTVLIIAITSLITLMTRIHLLINSNKKSLVYNSLNFGIAFGIIFLFAVIVDYTFHFEANFELFVIAFEYLDYWIINSFIFLIPFSFVFLLLFTNIGSVLYSHIKKKLLRDIQIVKEKTAEIDKVKTESTIALSDDLNSTTVDKSEFEIQILQKQLKNAILSPFFILGIALTIFTIIITIFPQIFTPYTPSQILTPSPGQYDPPSAEHPFGQAEFGKDVLAMVLYGIGDSFIFGLISLSIALIFGILIGLLMSYLNQKWHLKSEVIFIIIFIYPLIIIVLLLGITPINIGLMMTPIPAYILARTRFETSEILKKILISTPVILGSIILIYNGLGFLQFINNYPFQLGYQISIVRIYLDHAPWASLFPGLIIFIMTFGYFLIYISLQKSLNTTPKIIEEKKK